MSDDPLGQLARLLSRLPGVGKKSGARMAHFLWRANQRYLNDLGQAILSLQETVRACSECGRPTTHEPCSICDDPGRDHSVIMVVEDALDLEAIEAAGIFRGVYHVLGGVISPLAGKGPEKLSVPRLLERLAGGQAQEVVIATNPSAEGDATAAWIEELLEREAPAVARTRPARGLPAGTEIRFLDPLSLEAALKGRKGC